MATLPRFPRLPEGADSNPEAMQQFIVDVQRWGLDMVELTENRLVALEQGGQSKAFPVTLAPATVAELTTTGTPKFRAGRGYSFAFAINATNATATTGTPVWSDPTATNAVWRRVTDGSAI